MDLSHSDYATCSPGWVRKNQKVMCNLKILKHWVPNMIWLYVAIFGYRSIVSISGYTFRLAYFHIDNCWLPHPPGALLKTIQAEMWGTSSGYIWLVLWNMFFSISREYSSQVTFIIIFQWGRYHQPVIRSIIIYIEFWIYCDILFNHVERGFAVDVIDLK